MGLIAIQLQAGSENFNMPGSSHPWAAFGAVIVATCGVTLRLGLLVGQTKVGRNVPKPLRRRDRAGLPEESEIIKLLGAELDHIMSGKPAAVTAK